MAGATNPSCRSCRWILDNQPLYSRSECAQRVIQRVDAGQTSQLPDQGSSVSRNAFTGNSCRLSAPFLQKGANGLNLYCRAETNDLAGPVYYIDHFAYRWAGNNEGNAPWILQKRGVAPIPSGNRITFLSIYPGPGDVGGLGDFKDMMHGYWLFEHLALVAIYPRSSFVPTTTPKSST